MNIFALGDIAFYPDATPTLAGTAQLAFQEATLAARNIKAFNEGKELHTKHFEELGEAISLGTERAAVLTGGKAFGGALARQARFAFYTSRLPTWHHRLRVGASWFFEGTTPRPLLPLGSGTLISCFIRRRPTWLERQLFPLIPWQPETANNAVCRLVDCVAGRRLAINYCSRAIDAGGSLTLICSDSNLPKPSRLEHSYSRQQTPNAAADPFPTTPSAPPSFVGQRGSHHSRRRRSP